MPVMRDFTIKVEVPDFPPDEWLISEDGIPLESDWHASEIVLLRDLVHVHFQGRNDFFAGGNMFLYYNEEQARNKDYKGPDFFFVWGASPTPVRPYWAVWKEDGRYPNVIIELLSPSTADADLTTKKSIYEKTFRTPEYFCYDPDSQILRGWELVNEVYEPIKPNDNGWLWSKQLQLWLGRWEGSYQERDAIWLRFYTEQGTLVPYSNELTLVAQKQAEVERQRAEAERQRAEAERCRADAAEAELARLKAQMQSKKD